MDARKLLSFLRRRRASIVGGFLAVAAIVTAFTFLAPKTYVAKSSFLVEKETGSGTQALSVLDRVGRMASLETEIELIRSVRVIGPAVDELDLHVAVEVNGGWRRPSDVFGAFSADSSAVPGRYEIWEDSDGSLVAVADGTRDFLATAEPDDTISVAGMSVSLGGPARFGGFPVGLRVVPFGEAVEDVQGRLRIESEADLVSIVCQGRSPLAAQSLCLAVSESYLALRSELQRAEATAAAEFLAQQADLINGRLMEAEERLRDYTLRSQSVALEERASEEVQQNAVLWAQREQLRAERSALVALIRQIESDERGSRKYRDLASFPTFLKGDNQIVAALVENLVTLENRRNELRVKRTTEDLGVAAVDARIREIEEQLRSIAIGYEQALGAQVASLDQALENSRAVLDRIPAQQIESARLERQVLLLEQLYGFLQTRLQEAEIAQAVELPSVRVVDRASLPFKHSSPNEGVNLTVGFLLALSCGLLLGLLREYTDVTRIQEKRVVEGQTGVPVIGMIPRLKRPAPVIAVRLPAAPGHSAVVVAPKWTPEREAALEAFRALSTDLGFLGNGTSNGGMRMLAVTGAGRGEGKTFTACNLAITRASHGSLTLLIDGDLRGRGVARFLGLPQSPGLTELLESEVDLPGSLRRLEVGAGSQLYVMPAGAGSKRSAELLERHRFRRVLEKCRERFDLVVVDTPPLSLLTDASSIASQTDGVVIVVRSGTAERATLTLSMERLERAGASPVGVVLNVVDLPHYYRTYDYED